MLAVGDPDSSASQATFKLPKTASQMERADGAPIGTRGGIVVEHTFPADGDYVFSMDFFAEPLGLLFGNTAAGEQIEVVARRRAARALRHRSADERGEDRADDQDGAAARHGRHASRHGRVHPALRRADQRSDRADRSHDGGYRDRHGVRHHHAAAPAQPERHRSASRDRRLRHAEPAPHLHLPAARSRRRDRVRHRHRAAAGDAARSGVRSPSASWRG